MKCMLLIYAALSKAPDYTPEQRRAAEQRYTAYVSDVRAAGALGPDESFHTITKATTVRVRGGQTATTDGPTAETEEQLTGYFMLDCHTLEEALGWAAKNPAAKYGSIEVRPVDAAAW